MVTNTQTNQACQLWSVKQLAQALSLSKRQIHRLRAQGKIGPKEIKLGGSIRFRSEEVYAWINSNPGCADRETWEYMKQAAQS
jgi:excisionase family DNA binding protein